MIEVIKKSVNLVFPREMEEGQTGRISTGPPSNHGTIVLKRTDLLVGLNRDVAWTELESLTFQIELKNYQLKEVE